MAHKHIHPQALAFAVETTPCAAPADWTAETAIEFISMDLSGVKETLVGLAAGVSPTGEVAVAGRALSGLTVGATPIAASHGFVAVLEP